MQRGRRGAGEVAERSRAPVRRDARQDVVVDAPVGMQRTGAQPRRQPRNGGLALAEGARQRVRLATAVAAEERGARPAVERDCPHAIAEARGVGERDAGAVTRSVQLDVADAERRAHGIEILGRRARAVGVAPVADPPRAARAARVDQHDVALVAQRIEQRQHGRPRRPSWARRRCRR